MKINVLNTFFVIFSFASCQTHTDKIDREALVKRNNPFVTQFDTLASLSVDNGRFAVTVDAAGLQTFPELYAAGVPLGTQSHWGWHSFPNTKEYKFDETLEEYDFGHGQPGLYAIQPKPPKDSVGMTFFMRKTEAPSTSRHAPTHAHANWNDASYCRSI
jgi:hypothetical protein